MSASRWALAVLLLDLASFWMLLVGLWPFGRAGAVERPDGRRGRLLCRTPSATETGEHKKELSGSCGGAGQPDVRGATKSYSV